MNLLYITEDSQSSAHKLLAKALNELPDVSVTFCVIDRDFQAERQFDSSIEDEVHIPFKCNKKLYKYVFFYKWWAKWRMITKRIDIKKYDFVYASTLFSDGCIGLTAKRKYDIPYACSVRGTDVTTYLKKQKILYPLGAKLISKAMGLFCISKSIENAIRQSWCYRHASVNSDVMISIGNGINPFWHENKWPKKDKQIAEKFLYVGIFNDNKNVMNLITAIKDARNVIPNLELNLVGGGGEQHEDILKECENNDWIHFLGTIYDRNELMRVYRENDVFVMVSHAETLGLVYVEALSQGLPVVYSKGRGIDGMIPERCGVSCDPFNNDDITHAVLEIAQNYNRYYGLNNQELSRFEWNNIAHKIYETIKQ